MYREECVGDKASSLSQFSPRLPAGLSRGLTGAKKDLVIWLTPERLRHSRLLLSVDTSSLVLSSFCPIIEN